MTDSHLACSPTSLEEAIAEADAVCEARGMRLTRIRKKVLELLLENPAPSKAYDLLDRLDGEGAAKPPTIYRALDFLLDMGLAHKIESLNAYISCGHWGHAHSAVFLICESCDEVNELDAPETSKALMAETRGVGFEPRRSVIEVRGTCLNCTG